MAISGNTITVTEVGVGETTIAIMANDNNGGTVSDEFVITVNEVPVDVPLVSGIDDDVVSLINVYPNPSSSYLRIDLPTETRWYLQIFEPSGKILRGNLQELEQSTILDVSYWKEGIYYFRLFNENQYTTTKVLIGG